MKIPALFTVAICILIHSANAYSLSPDAKITLMSRDSNGECQKYSNEKTALMDAHFVKTDLAKGKSLPLANVGFDGVLSVRAKHVQQVDEMKPVKISITVVNRSYLIEIPDMEAGWSPRYTDNFLIIPERKGTKDPSFTYYDYNNAHWLQYVSGGNLCHYTANYDVSDVVSFQVARKV